MSSQNDTIVDVSNLTQDDLLDAYEKLAKSYRNVKVELDETTQKLHSQNQQRKVNENLISDLQSELDQLNFINASELQQCEKRSEEFKAKNSELIMQNQLLEEKIDNFGILITELRSEVESLKGLLTEKTIKPRISDAHTNLLEIENNQLRSRVNDLEFELKDVKEQLADCNEGIEQYREKVVCLEENGESKKAELDEKIEMIDQMQEKINEMTAELFKFSTSTVLDDDNRKGNSLFAEVDDQRQKMKQILLDERQEYLSMKKSFNAKEMEIRRLKRENLNIKSEIQSCSRLLSCSESRATQSLNLYVAHLENEKKQLENQLREMETRLVDIATNRKLNWIEALMTNASKELREMKDKVFVLMREKNSAMDNYSKVSKDLARIKLDIVKYKTLLGQIVFEFQLKIQPGKYVGVGLGDDFLESLKYEHFEEECDDTGVMMEIKDESRTFNDLDSSFNGSTSSMNTKNDWKFIPKQPSPLKQITPVIPVKPQVLTEKSVQFSSETKTRVIDSTQEGLEESRLARKRAPLTVKRYVIPSKVHKKENL